MKNKVIILIQLILTFFLFFHFNFLSANDVLINAEVVDIKDKGNLVIATRSVNINDGNNIEITGEEAKYNKINQTIEIIGNVIFFDKEKNYKAMGDKFVFNRNKKTLSSIGNTIFNLYDDKNKDINFEIKSENSFFDQKKNYLELKDGVFLKDLNKNYEINSNKIIYFNTKELFKSYGDTKINYNNQFLIVSSDIEYNRIKQNFYTDKKTIIDDNFNNKFIHFDKGKKCI